MVIYPVCIIGAGPAGIATAVELLKRGYQAKDIVILEKSGEVAHMINSKYPEEKPVLANYKERMAECVGDLCITDMSKQDFLDYLKNVIREKQLNIHYHQNVEKIVRMKNGREWRVDCQDDSWPVEVIFIAIGNMSAPRTLGVSIDSQVTDRVVDDIQSLSIDDHPKVLVVGGGDSAIEYAAILEQRGHQVCLSYRKSEFTRLLPANLENIQSLINNKKIEFYPSSVIKKITATNENAKSAQLKVSFQGAQDNVFDAIVTALGNERPKTYLEKIGIELGSESGQDFLESDAQGLFLVGDLASGKSGGSINFAFNSGTKAVSKACSLYLDCDL